MTYITILMVFFLFTHEIQLLTKKEHDTNLTFTNNVQTRINDEKGYTSPAKNIKFKGGTRRDADGLDRVQKFLRNYDDWSGNPVGNRT
jgi:hypothetical protein